MHQQASIYQRALASGKIMDMEILAIGSSCPMEINLHGSFNLMEICGSIKSGSLPLYYQQAEYYLLLRGVRAVR